MSRPIETAQSRSAAGPPLPPTSAREKAATSPEPSDAPEPHASETMLTYAQASEFLNVPVGTLYDWVHRKAVPHVRLGPRLVRFPRLALSRWLDARAVAEKGEALP